MDGLPAATMTLRSITKKRAMVSFRADYLSAVLTTKKKRMYLNHVLVVNIHKRSKARTDRGYSWSSFI